MDDLPMVDINGTTTNPSDERPRTVGDININDPDVDHALSLDYDQTHQDGSLTHSLHVHNPVPDNDQGHQDSPLTHDTCDDQALDNQDSSFNNPDQELVDGQSHHVSINQCTSDNQDSLIHSVPVDNHNDNLNHAHIDQDKSLSQPTGTQNDTLIFDQATPNSKHSQDQYTSSTTQTSNGRGTSLTYSDHNQGSQEPLAPHGDQMDSLHEADEQNNHFFNGISIDDFISDDV